MEKLESKVKNAIDKYGLINKNERVLVGLSGGADSVALLHVLLKIAPEMGFELCAAHLNHGIRGAEAYHDQHFVEELCKGLGVPLVCEGLDIPGIARAEGKTLEQHLRSQINDMMRETDDDRIKDALRRAMDMMEDSGLLGTLTDAILNGEAGEY